MCPHLTAETEGHEQSSGAVTRSTGSAAPVAGFESSPVNDLFKGSRKAAKKPPPMMYECLYMIYKVKISHGDGHMYETHRKSAVDACHRSRLANWPLRAAATHIVLKTYICTTTCGAPIRSRILKANKQCTTALADCYYTLAAALVSITVSVR